MAGIRGVQNPFPTKLSKATGLFKQRASTTSPEADLRARAVKTDPPKPKGRTNKAPKRQNSHYTNQGLKRGTAG